MDKIQNAQSQKKKYVYETCYFSYNGKIYKVYGKTKEEALRKKEEKLLKLKNDSNESNIYDSNTIVDKWFDVILKVYKFNTSLATINSDINRYNKYIKPIIGHMPIAKVNEIKCQEILNQVNQMSYSTVNKLKQLLKFIFAKALENGLIKRNPTAALIAPECEKGTHRDITEEERKHIYKVYEDNKLYLYFIIMLECGCRPAEVRQLNGGDIDHEKRILHIRGTKTKYSDRYVGISDDLYEIIKDIQSNDPIVCDKNGKRYTENTYKSLMHQFKYDLNVSMGAKTYKGELIPPLPLKEDFEPYCLRHTYCTDLFKAGVDIKTSSKLMGHSNIESTANIYTHVGIDQIIDANKKMNEYLQSKKT